jgi:hypothetical protein
LEKKSLLSENVTSQKLFPIPGSTRSITLPASEARVKEEVAMMHVSNEYRRLSLL